MRISVPAVAGLALLALVGGCTTTPAPLPVEVTRYRVDTVGRGTVAIVAASAGDLGPVQFGIYADAIARELGALGYTVLPAAPDAAARAEYVATVALDTDSRIARSRSPVSLGLGAGGFSGGGGGGVGLGGGISFPIGRARPLEEVAATLSVKIDTRAGAGVWEGRAQGREVRHVGEGDATATAGRLAHALFTGFPGESGRTIEVK